MNKDIDQFKLLSSGRKSLFSLPIVLILTINCLGHTLSKSGIEVSFSGSEGSDWHMESLYHDERIFPNKIVYIKDTTLINLYHNSKNVVGRGRKIGVDGDDSQPNSGDEGVIRYKVDLERSHTYGPYTGSSSPSYSDPFSFSSLSYPDSSRVVGGIGDNGENLSDPTKYWTKGTLDSVGDEWHTMLVWDDDSFLNSENEYKASDGSYLTFVLNPKAPCLKWSTSGPGQFYTTPAKNYWTPVIYDQTTYFEGSVVVEIRDINGNDVYYSINGAPFVDSNSKSATLNQSNFIEGENTLDFYYEGNQQFVKRRRIVKNPDHPSDQEIHGNILWENDEGWKKISSRWGKGAYAEVTEKMVENDAYNELGKWYYRTGHRITPEKAIISAIVSKKFGTDAYKKQFVSNSSIKDPFAIFAKEMLLDNPRTMDATGYERSWAGEAIPNKEQFYRGYWDVNPILSTAFAYDIMIDIFSTDEDSDGISSIEDYFIRDCLASWAWECMQVQSNMVTSNEQRGMWGSMRSLGGAVIAMIMPEYSTEYYGTSGFGTKQDTYEWCPYPNQKFTWKEILYDHPSSVSVIGYPNLGYARNTDYYGIEGWGNFRENESWSDKSGYIESGLCRRTYEIILNLSAQRGDNPQELFPYVYAAFRRMTTGNFFVNGGEAGPYRKAAFLLMNDNFAELAANNLDWIKNHATGNETEAQQFYLNAPYSLIWYDDGADSVAVVPPSVPKTESIRASHPSGSYTESTSITLQTDTPNATIHYTLDGTYPTAQSPVYNSPLEIEQSTTVKAVAIKKGLANSDLYEGLFTIGLFKFDSTLKSASILEQRHSTTFSFTARPTEIDDTIFGLGDRPASALQDMACLIRFNTDGFIDVYNGSKKPSAWYDSTVPYPYTSATAYNFEVHVNLDEKTYNVFVKEPGGNRTQLAREFTFRNPNENIETIDTFSYMTFGSRTDAEVQFTRAAVLKSPSVLTGKL